MPTRGVLSPAATVRDHPRLWTTAAVLALALLLVTLLGGWASSRSEGAVRVEAGTEVEAAPFRVRLDQASARFELHGDAAEEGRALVVVEGWIELTVPESVSASVVTQAFTADLRSAYDEFGSPAEVPEPTVRVSADGVGLRGLGPGLRYDIQLTFVVDQEAVPERLTVTVLEQSLRPSALDGDLGWYDAEPIALVPLDVAPLPAARPEPESF
ncbi:hypothetical protein [Nocardioides sp. cx-173]|uniref:hypothetical protein n=1 Tax=Nocardioides sp. cx-173 TaxID=2898796 RepID=UPI001E3C7D5B|nr:hypothetical protein [Nocardioides sp. cx-173]MCD4525217.1 hypothetical protein [Nocardioides sp. cx-173]UGB40980.1 hypothetical protein LQ940_16580 [Nocardioides sp. cx-173]